MSESIHPTIAIITDFGVSDSYVGIMKAVMLAIAPDLHFIDISHAIPPGEIRQASFEAWRSAPYLPPGSVLLIVVDPGVGTGRRPIAIQTPDLLCVGPDNGVFTLLLHAVTEATAVEISNREYTLDSVSSTFHGRDIFAPAAAYLSTGLDLHDLGPTVEYPTTHPMPLLDTSQEEAIRGEVVHIDHFGNLITSIGKLHLHGENLRLAPWIGEATPHTFKLSSAILKVGEIPIPLHRTFGEVPVGEPVAYTGSCGLLEAAINGNNASTQLGVGLGEPVTLIHQG